MKKQKFTLRVVLGDKEREWLVVESGDYDYEVGLVRYGDTIYDIRTGLHTVRLGTIRAGGGTWRKIGCSRVADLKMSEMLFYVKNNNLFLMALEKARNHPQNLERETKNESPLKEITLFNM